MIKPPEISHYGLIRIPDLKRLNLPATKHSVKTFPLTGKNVLLTTSDGFIIGITHVLRKALPGCFINNVKPYSDERIVYDELKRKRYDLIIMTNTVMLRPEIGFVAEYVKNNYPDMRIIVLSGDTHPGFIDFLNRVPIDAFFKLPFKFISLKHKIIEIMLGRN